MFSVPRKPLITRRPDRDSPGSRPLRLSARLSPHSAPPELIAAGSRLPASSPSPPPLPLLKGCLILVDVIVIIDEIEVPVEGLSHWTMSGAKNRLSGILGHFLPSQSGAPDSTAAGFNHHFNYHTLSPTFFLPRAAAIEPEVCHNRLKLRSIPSFFSNIRFQRPKQSTMSPRTTKCFGELTSRQRTAHEVSRTI